MLGCNQKITLWIREKDPETGKEIFVRHLLPVKCRWSSFTERDARNGAANIYAGVIIIVPYFDGLRDLNIKEGDIAAPGACEINITGESPHTASEVRRRLAPDITTIKSVARNYNGDMKGEHLRLAGN